jgi:hypothetical protein
MNAPPELTCPSYARAEHEGPFFGAVKKHPHLCRIEFG